MAISNAIASAEYELNKVKEKENEEYVVLHKGDCSVCRRNNYCSKKCPALKRHEKRTAQIWFMNNVVKLLKKETKPDVEKVEK